MSHAPYRQKPIEPRPVSAINAKNMRISAAGTS